MDWSDLLHSKKQSNKSESMTENLNSLLFLVDSIKSDFDLEKIYHSIGENLLKFGISTVISTFDKSNNEFKIKHFFSENNSLISLFKKICELSEKNFFNSEDYENVYRDQVKLFSSSRLYRLSQKYGKNGDQAEIGKLKSIIVPMMLQGEFLGFVEYIGENLLLQNASIFESFTLNLVKSVANIILFSEIKKTGERYKDIFENANEGFFILDPSKKKFIEVNNAMTKISGYTTAELEQMNFILLFADTERAKIEKKFKSILDDSKNKANYNFETEILTKSKEIKIIEFKICRILNPHEWFVIVVDITESKKLLEKIAKAKLQNETIIDTISDALFVLDRQLKITNFNKEFLDKVKAQPKEIKNNKCFDILPRYEYGIFQELCNCNDHHGAAMCEIRKVFQTKKPYTIEKKVQSNSKVKYLKIKIFPSLDKDDEVFQIVVLISDITETKKAEEDIRNLQRFQEKIFNNLPVSILVIDRDKKIISYNSFSEKLMGRHVKGRILTEASEIKNNKRIFNKYNLLIEKGKAFYNEDLSYTERKTQKQKHLNLLAVPLFDENLGRIEGAISIALDDTEEINAKNKLEELNKNLEEQIAKRTGELAAAYQQISQLLELKTKFIADASHELRTPLTIIQGNLDLAIREEEQKDNHEIPELYEIIRHEINQVSGILSDLTMLANADSGAEQIMAEPVNLSKVIDNSILSMKIIADTKKIRLQNKNEFKNLEIIGDETKLERMLLNFLRNSIKYNNEKGWVSVRTEKKENEVVLFVEDNGIGIPDKDLPFIFERFYRVDKSRSRAEGGTGLGLPICKWIVNAHGGYIKVNSKLGSGTIFEIHFPYDYKKMQLIVPI